MLRLPRLSIDRPVTANAARIRLGSTPPRNWTPARGQTSKDQQAQIGQSRKQLTQNDVCTAQLAGEQVLESATFFFLGNGTRGVDRRQQVDRRELHDQKSGEEGSGKLRQLLDVDLAL